MNLTVDDELKSLEAEVRRATRLDHIPRNKLGVEIHNRIERLKDDLKAAPHTWTSYQRHRLLKVVDTLLRDVFHIAVESDYDPGPEIGQRQLV